MATQSYVCDAGLAPKKITTPAYDAIQNYSYHLNANKFAGFLAKHATANLGVTQIKANVVDVNLDGNGFICSVNTDTAGVLAADFFVDCSGSKALLINGALDVAWHKIDDVLFNDTAIAMQVPYESADTPIATHTIATAHEAGWTWDIGLENRRGVGYVYSSDYTTDERAEEVLREYAGPMSEGIAVRKIPLNLGYREKFWHKNCVAIGMSAAFIEPLEASAIFLVEAAANMLADQFPRTLGAMQYVEEKYNSTFRWNAKSDFFEPDLEDSVLLQRISEQTGVDYEEILNEFETRVYLLKWMLENNIRSYKKVSETIGKFYRDPRSIMKKIGYGV